MAWQRNSVRRARLPPDWPTRRRKVRDRAGGRCQAKDEDGNRCPLPGTDCDHVHDPADHGLANLQWLCKDHHKFKTQQQATAAAAAKRAAALRAPQRHPGLL